MELFDALAYVEARQREDVDGRALLGQEGARDHDAIAAPGGHSGRPVSRGVGDSTRDPIASGVFDPCLRVRRGTHDLECSDPLDDVEGGRV